MKVLKPWQLRLLSIQCGTKMFRSHNGKTELAAHDPENYCPGRAILGSGKNEKPPASKSAQAAPSDMPLATSLG